MAESRQVSARESGAVQAQPQAKGREEEMTMAPSVDIREDAHGITLKAEMPGVSKDRLNVQADRNALLIEGEVSIELPQGIEAMYADVQATKYRRSFTLSSELDCERIQARLEDGVLTLHIPKRAEFTPRKIEVQSA